VTIRAAAIWLVLSGLAFGLGLALGLAFLGIANGLLPAFRPEDDDTMREFFPVALAYAVWAATTLAGSIVAWRLVRSRR
jgi:hypothetical protein